MYHPSETGGLLTSELLCVEAVGSSRSELFHVDTGGLSLWLHLGHTELPDGKTAPQVGQYASAGFVLALGAAVELPQ